MKRTYLFMIIIILSLTSNIDAETSDNKCNLMLIFDASGSMWGQIDGKCKIEIAREAVGTIVKELPSNVNIGLVAYGHRRKGDCDDVETLISLGPLNADSFLKKVNSLNPKGKTPMYRSIRMTAESIRHLEDETTILLISDGKETCDPDPCASVAELKSLGIKFILHIVGFDVSKDVEEQLKCMARAGGGEYFPAKDAKKLKDSLNRVIEKTVEKNLEVSLMVNGKPVGVSLELINTATGKKLPPYQSSEQKPLRIYVEPGIYTVKVIDEWEQEGRPSKTFENVKIEKSSVRTINAEFGSGTLKVWSIRNNKTFKGSVLVKDMNGETVGRGWKTSYTDKPAEYILLPGRYNLSVEDSWGTGSMKEIGIIEIQSGDILEHKVVFDSGTLKVWNLKDGKPISGSVIVKDMKGNTMGGGWATSYTDRPAEYTLEVGKYKLSVEDSWGDPVVMLDYGTIDIKSGEDLEIKCDFDNPPTPSDLHNSSETADQPATNPVDNIDTSSIPTEQHMHEMAAKAQAEAMKQMQEAMTSFPNAFQNTSSDENSKDLPLPIVTDEPGDTGSKLPESYEQTQDIEYHEVDYSNVGAQDTGGGLDDMDAEAEAAYIPKYDPDEFKVGNPLTTKRHIQTLSNRLNSSAEKARSLNRIDTEERISTARQNLDHLSEELKKRAPKEELQTLLNRCAQEIFAIQMSLIDR